MPLPEWYTSPFRYKQADLDQMDLYNKQIEDYKTAAEAYNAALDKYKADVELYNERVNAWNKGPRTSDFGYKPPAEFTMAQPKALDFTQEDLDAFQQEAQARATRAQQARNTAYTAAINPSQYNLAGFSFADGGDVSADRAAFIKQWYDEKYGDSPSRYVVNDRGYMTDPRYKALMTAAQDKDTPPTTTTPTVIDKSATSVAPTVSFTTQPVSPASGNMVTLMGPNTPLVKAEAAPGVYMSASNVGIPLAPGETQTISREDAEERATLLGTGEPSKSKQAGPYRDAGFYTPPTTSTGTRLPISGLFTRSLSAPSTSFVPVFPENSSLLSLLEGYKKDRFANGGPVDARPAYQRLLAAIQGPRNLADGGEVERDPLAVSEEGITVQGPQAQADYSQLLYDVTADLTPGLGEARSAQRSGEAFDKAKQAFAAGDYLSALGFGSSSAAEALGALPIIGMAARMPAGLARMSPKVVDLFEGITAQKAAIRDQIAGLGDPKNVRGEAKKQLQALQQQEQDLAMRSVYARGKAEEGVPEEEIVKILEEGAPGWDFGTKASRTTGQVNLQDVFATDHGPDAQWLKSKQETVKAKGRDKYGVPNMSSITGYFRGQKQPVVSVEELAKLKGARGEQANPRKKDLEWIKKDMQENGLANMGAPFITVGYDGVPWVSEGNHRIMAAKELGIETLPVEIRYFDGGEMAAKGAFAPEELAKTLQEPVKLNFANGGEVTNFIRKRAEGSPEQGEEMDPESVGEARDMPTMPPAVKMFLGDVLFGWGENRGVSEEDISQEQRDWFIQRALEAKAQKEAETGEPVTDLYMSKWDTPTSPEQIGGFFSKDPGYSGFFSPAYQLRNYLGDTNVRFLPDGSIVTRNETYDFSPEYDKKSLTEWIKDQGLIGAAGKIGAKYGTREDSGKAVKRDIKWR